MHAYYDKSGNPITFFEALELKKDPTYFRVRETTLEDGKWISTVWLGLDHSFNGQKPLIFETMVFKDKGLEVLDSKQYTTLEEAEQGHEKVVLKYTAMFHMEQSLKKDIKN